MVLFLALLGCGPKDTADTGGPVDSGTPDDTDPTDTGPDDTDPTDTDTAPDSGDTDPGDSGDTAPDTGDTDTGDTADTGPGDTGDTAAPTPPRWSGEHSIAEADAVLLGDTFGERVGLAMIGGTDYDGDGAADLVVGADLRSGGRGAFYVLPATVSGNYPLAGAPVRVDGERSFDQAGHILAHGGDIDGDGTPDLLSGAFKADLDETDAGAAWVHYGPVTSGTTADAVRIGGVAANDTAGHAVNGLGDVDGDGLSDFAVGAEGADAGGADAGAVYLFQYAPTANVTLDDADFVLVGEGAGYRVGHNVLAPTDLTGDGYDDVVVCAPEADGAATDAGALYVMAGPVTTSGSLASATAIYDGEAAGDEAGHHAVSLGDTDGDGLPDLAIDAWYQDGGGADAGAVYVVRSPHAGRASLSSAWARWDGEAAGDEAAVHLAAADINGDGADDLWLGAYRNDVGASSAGAAYLLYAPFDAGVFDLGSADAVFRGESAGHELGFGVGSAGDTDGDGTDDVMVGTFNGGAGGGAVYLVRGG